VKDPGGATNFGITLKALEQHRGTTCTADDVRAMQQAEAIAIYEAVYAPAILFDDLPSGVDLICYDSAINMGRFHTVQFLQRAMGIADDGALGPATLEAVGTILAVMSVPVLIAGIRVQRETFYRGLSTFSTFGAGWLNRLGAVENTAINWAANAGG
jgi:lysozyme family protein